MYWVGYNQPTWEPTRTIETDCPDLVYCYESSILTLLQYYKNDAVNARAVAADHMNRVYQECRQLEAHCRSLDEKLQKAMQNRNLRANFECYLCKAGHN